MFDMTLYEQTARVLIYSVVTLCTSTQGETSLKFIWYVLRKQNPNVPALSTVKKWRLPGTHKTNVNVHIH